MDDKGNADTSRTAEPEGAVSTQPGESRADKLRAQIEQAQAPSKDQGESPSPEKPEPTPGLLEGKHRIKWGEAEREMDISELVKLAQQGQEAEQTLAAARKLVGEDYPQVQQIAQQYQNMTPRQRAAFEKLLNSSAADDGDDDVDPLLSELADEDDGRTGEENGETNQQLLERLSRIERYVQSQSQRDARQQVETKIDALIKSYPDLNASDVAKGMARKAIIDSLLLNPNQKVEDLVAEQAGNYLKMVREQRQAAVERAGQPRPEPVSLGDQDVTLKPERSPTGDDLEKGEIRRMLAQRLREEAFNASQRRQ